MWTLSQPSLIASSWARSLRAWKRPNISTRPKCASQSARNSSARYSFTCQGLSDFSAPGGASVSRFGVETKATPPGPSIDLKCSRIAPGVLDVLDRLQEDDGVAGLGERLDQVALEAQVRARVAEPRVLVRFGVGVDADDARGAAGEDVGAVALAAGHVDDALAADPPGDPLVDDQVAAEPVVLLGHVGQRPLAGQRQRRHPRWLVQL